MKTHLRYATLALAALLVISLVVCGGLVVPAQADVIDVTVTTDYYQRADGLNRYHQSETFIGAVEASARFVPAELADLGINAYRLYVGMNRLETQDDDGVYGSPTPAEIKTDPNLVPWTFWDTAFQTDNTYAWHNSDLAVSFEDMIVGLRQNDVEPVLCVRLRDNFGNPTWIPSDPQTTADHNEWWEFVFAVAYWLNVRNDYQITYWEILNEPNGGDYAGGMDEYAEVLDDAYDAIHFVNDGAGLPTVIMAPNNGDHDEQWIDGMLQRRDAKIDVVDYHEYAADQDAYSRGYWDRVFNNDTDGVIEPIWNGEWGSALKGYDSLSIALRIARGLMEHASSDMYGSTVFSMYDWVGNKGRSFAGLVRADGSKTEGYWAMRLVIRGLQGAKTLYQVQTADTTLFYLAARDADALYLLAHNESGSTNTINADVSAHVQSGTATVYEYSSANKDVVVATPALSAGQFSFGSPKDSVVLAVIPLSGGPLPTDTPVPPTDTPVPPTDTPVPPTDTPEGPTDTPAPPTDTPVPTDTPLPPTDTPVPPTDTPAPPTDTPAPTNTPGGGGTIFFDGFEDGDMSDWTRSSTAAQIRDDTCYEGSYCAGTKLGAWFSRTISTAGYTNVHLKYAGMTKGMDAGESLRVEWYDGSEWHLVEELLSNDVYLYRDWTLPAGAAGNADFGVRFTGNADKNTEWGYADNVEVTGE